MISDDVLRTVMIGYAKLSVCSRWSEILSVFGDTEAAGGQVQPGGSHGLQVMAVEKPAGGNVPVVPAVVYITSNGLALIAAAEA